MEERSVSWMSSGWRRVVFFYQKEIAGIPPSNGEGGQDIPETNLLKPPVAQRPTPNTTEGMGNNLKNLKVNYYRASLYTSKFFTAKLHGKITLIHKPLNTKTQ